LRSDKHQKHCFGIQTALLKKASLILFPGAIEFQAQQKIQELHRELGEILFFGFHCCSLSNIANYGYCISRWFGLLKKIISFLGKYCRCLSQTELKTSSYPDFYAHKPPFPPNLYSYIYVLLFQLNF